MNRQVLVLTLIAGIALTGCTGATDTQSGDRIVIGVTTNESADVVACSQADINLINVQWREDGAILVGLNNGTIPLENVTVALYADGQQLTITNAGHATSFVGLGVRDHFELRPDTPRAPNRVTLRSTICPELVKTAERP